MKMCRWEMFPGEISPLTTPFFQPPLPTARSPHYTQSLLTTSQPINVLYPFSPLLTPKPMQCNIVTFLARCVPALTDNLGQKGPRGLSIEKFRLGNTADQNRWMDGCLDQLQHNLTARGLITHNSPPPIDVSLDLLSLWQQPATSRHVCGYDADGQAVSCAEQRCASQPLL
jgi:hypothetical protein